jgi:hypothetical protein
LFSPEYLHRNHLAEGLSQSHDYVIAKVGVFSHFLQIIQVDLIQSQDLDEV